MNRTLYLIANTACITAGVIGDVSVLQLLDRGSRGGGVVTGSKFSACRPSPTARYAVVISVPMAVERRIGDKLITMAAQPPTPSGSSAIGLHGNSVSLTTSV